MKMKMYELEISEKNFLIYKLNSNINNNSEIKNIKISI